MGRPTNKQKWKEAISKKVTKLTPDVIQKLKEALNPEFQTRFQKDILIEVVTKRFEYTFESMWKCLKEILLEEGIQALSPLSCFQEAFHAGLIPKEHEAIFPTMVKKRFL